MAFGWCDFVFLLWLGLRLWFVGIGLDWIGFVEVGGVFGLPAGYGVWGFCFFR